MENFSYVFAFIVIILLLCMYFHHFGGSYMMGHIKGCGCGCNNKNVQPIVVTSPTTPASEHMIASNSIMRLSRGYNGMNTGGSYADAMNTLSEAEKMSLSSVETDTRSMNGPREPNM
jgi:hypothetical protein